MQQEALWVGCGAGFAGDRLDAPQAVVDALISSGGPACLIFETLAERTLALAQLRRRADPEAGYLPTLAELLGPILARCLSHRIPIVGNFGAANPAQAARRIVALAAELGCGPIRVAAVTGDDMLAVTGPQALLEMNCHPPVSIRPEQLVAANVYLGAQGIARALEQGADVVVTGRVADPALALGPLVHHFGWRWDDWDRMACGVLAGHLLECGAQVTGGYFADPGVKNVPGLARIGYPVARINSDGDILITKPAGTGGEVSERTVKEQVLYEIHDPSAYLTPDVVLDLTEVEIHQTGPDQVRVSGARGKPRPATLKATVCFDGGWMGEGEISYAGPNARARGQLALETLKERFALLGLEVESQFDLIGLASIFNDNEGRWLQAMQANEVPEVRARLAVRGHDKRAVERALQEVEALYTTGPAGGGGVRTSITALMNSTSVYVARNAFEAQVAMLEG